jgi:Xaa-Pro aminopeptidase
MIPEALPLIAKAKKRSRVSCTLATVRWARPMKGAPIMLDVVKKVAPSIPFDADRLDRLMDEAGIDVLLVTSKHNVQYLLGGHRAFFFESMDAMGLSRYLPVLVYPKGVRQKAAYFGHRMEGFQKENETFWVPESQTNSSGSVDAMEKAIDYVRRSGVKAHRIGAELAFLP